MTAIVEGRYYLRGYVTPALEQAQTVCPSLTLVHTCNIWRERLCDLFQKFFGGTP